MSSNNTGIQFQRPIGPCADMKELEYIAALHQTELEEIRTDATIHAKDIRNYLTSRHGVYVSAPNLERRIIQEMCGTQIKDLDGDGEDDNFKEPMMDLCQLVSLLIIPYLRQEDLNEAQKPANSLIHGMAEQVLKLIMEEMEIHKVDLTKYRGIDENFETGTRITPGLVQAMLDTYGEYHVPDEVLQEMAAMAAPTGDEPDDKSGNGDDSGSGSMDDPSEEFSDEEQGNRKPKAKSKPKRSDDGYVVMLNKDSFQRALTADIQLYNPQWENVQSTHQQDVQSIPVNPDRPEDDIIDMDPKFYTAPSVDQSADQYRSVLWMMLLWISFLFHFISYAIHPDGWIAFSDCENEFACTLASTTVNWLTVFGHLGISGFVYIFVGSWGNSSDINGMGSGKAMAALGVFLAMGHVAAATIVPVFLTGEAFVWNITPNPGWEMVHWFCFSLGIVLIVLQFIRLVDICAPLGIIGAGGRTRTEQCTKEAATKKVNTLMDNAMLLHVAPVLAGQQVKTGSGWKFPAKHASPIVVEVAADLHEKMDPKGQKYRGGSNIQSLTGGDGRERALRHFIAMEKEHVTETTGGVLWSLERMADGRLYDEEGVWFSARLLASNCIQWLVAVAVVVFYFAALGWFEEQKENTVAIGRRRMLEEDVRDQEDALTEYVEAYERALREKQQHEVHRQIQRHHHQRQRLLRRLQDIEPVNSTHYRVTGQAGVYPNLIYDVNSTHFTDGTNFWPYALNSHNGTHVFDKYFPYNETGFSDGRRFFPFSQFATNGTHMTNGDYLFDGSVITKLPGNSAVNNIEDWEFQVGLSVALVAALLATVGIAVVYVPSLVSTVLKFRSGVFGTLKGGQAFQQLRESPHRVTTLLGCALWGSVATAILSALLVGGVAFLAVWSETRTIAETIGALLVGLLVVYLIKYMFVRLFRDLYVSSFYRKHPAVINLINVLLESWNLALTIGNILLRSIKLLIVTAAYLGRIDVPLFAPGVGYVGPFALDSEHFSFKNDLLIHEAVSPVHQSNTNPKRWTSSVTMFAPTKHRHPYMERLGYMYLMKLRHGSDFGTKAGAYWRILFVQALMPWLRAYRRRHFGKRKPNRDGNSDDEDDKSGPTLPDDGSVMSLHGMELEIDVVKRANDSLTQRNISLKQAVTELRDKLREANKNAHRLERRLKRAKDKKKSEKSKSIKKPGPNSVDGGAASKKSAADTKVGGATADFEEDFQSDSEEETFSQAVARERAKLVTQVRESDERNATEPPVAVTADEVEDDEAESDENDDDEDIGSQAKVEKQAKSSPRASKTETKVDPVEGGEDSGAATMDEDIQSEDDNEDNEESLEDILRKHNASAQSKSSKQKDAEPKESFEDEYDGEGDDDEESLTNRSAEGGRRGRDPD